MNNQIQHYRERLQDVLDILVGHGSLGLLLIDTSQFSRVEHDYGSKAYQTMLRRANEIIVDLASTELRFNDIVTTGDKAGDSFLVFLTPKRTGESVRVADLEAAAQRIEQNLNRRMSALALPFLRGRPKFTVGFALVLHNPLVTPERIVTRLIEEAGECARFLRTISKFKRRSRLLEILLNEQVTTLFQPLVHLRDQTVLGYEALSRGPQGTPFESPVNLFDMADESDLVFELDRLCRRRALASSSGLESPTKLFINVLPSAMYDPDFSGRRLIEYLDELGLSPEQIVFEITEKYAIEDYSLFSEAVRDFTEVGFSVAVDDIGAGHSGLEKIANLNPRFLKFDIHLTRDIDASYVRREMVRALKELGDKMESTIIAEGIEREEELQTLIDLGIEYGQGFLLGRPGPRLDYTAENSPRIPLVVEEPRPAGILRAGTPPPNPATPA